LGFKSTDKRPQITQEMLEKVGYIEHLKSNESFIFEQIRIKAEDSVQAERFKCNNLVKFNRLLEACGWGFLAVEIAKHDILAFKNKVFEFHALRELCQAVIQHGKDYICEKTLFQDFPINESRLRILKEFSNVYISSFTVDRLFNTFIECRITFANTCPDLYKDTRPINSSILSIIREMNCNNVVLLIVLGETEHRSLVIGGDFLGHWTDEQMFAYVNRNYKYDFVRASFPHFIIVRER
jgi:hypothetical protein